VRFAEKLDNDESLDSQDRERIEHNLKYNDDTIFDNISIFRDLNDSGLVIRPRIKDKKDVHPLKLKIPIDIDEEEEEEEEGEDPREFWGIEPIPKANTDGVSPIQTRKPNNSSQDMSKDLIELDNDNAMKKLDDMIDTSILNNSGNDPMRKKRFFDDASHQPSAIIGKKEPTNQDTEQFFEEFDPTQAQASNPVVFTDSEDIPKEDQNTLILDSQSMIIDPNKEHNLSQQMMQSLEASSIMQPA
jgi:hypothetical protein